MHEIKPVKHGVLKFILALCVMVSPRLVLSQPASPTLSLQLSGANVLISWPGSGFWLQAAETLGPPSPWYNNRAWPIGNTGPDQYTATIPVEGTARFFRVVASTSLPPPTRLEVDSSDGLLSVHWDAVSNAASYNLYYATVPGVSQFNYSSLPGGTKIPGIFDPNYYLESLAPGTRYYFVASATAPNSDESADSNEDSGLFSAYGQVHGSFFTLLPDGTNNFQVAVPGVNISLVNLNTGVTNVVALSDGGGQFVATLVPAGAYQLCWSAHGYLSGCSTQEVTLSNNVVYLEPERLIPVPTGLVYGTVVYQDGTPAVFQNGVFGLDLGAELLLRDTNAHTIASTRVNAHGDYVLAGVPVGSNLVLSATFELAHVDTMVDTTATGPVVLVLPTTPPNVDRVVPTLNGVPVSFGPPGATIQVTADVTSMHSNSPSFTWLPGQGGEGLVPSNSHTVALVLPPTNSPVTAQVLVGDGYGGYDFGALHFYAKTFTYFSGLVVDSLGTPIVGAQARVNNQATLSDTNGDFAMSLPVGQAPYALDIEAAGYAPYGASYPDSSIGQIYVLQSLTNNACFGYTGAGFTVADGHGTIVQVPDNSLQDNGTSYLGPICVEILTYDPCSAVFPAGTEAVGPGNEPEYLAPLASAFIQILGSTNQVLTLAPGMAATITIPIGPGCVTTNGVVPIQTSWIWDATNARWRIAASATNGVVIAGSFTGPFFQMGMAAVGQPAARGVVTLTPDRTLSLPLQVRVAGKTTVIPFQDASGDNPKEEIPIPLNIPVTIEVLNPKEAPGAYYVNPNVPGTIRDVADKTVIMQIKRTFTQSTDVPLSLSNHISTLTSKRLDKAPFLAFPSSSQVSVKEDKLAAGKAYYSAINFEKDQNSFFTWMRKNAFLPPNGNYPADYTQDVGVVYFNATDLGFGRSMHMRLSPGADGKKNVAFYVVNYHAVEHALEDKIGVTLPPDKQAIATVAMDYAYDTVKKKRYTKFYVFDFGSGPTRRANPDADLDGGGVKLNPNLCVVCHGSQPIRLNYKQGPYDVAPADGDVKGRFIPFDLESFTYSAKAGVDKAAMRELNRAIFLYTDITPAMSNVLSGWYSGALTNGNNNDFKVNYVPAGWNTKSDLYLSTVRVSCRGCHLMRDGKLGFNTWDDFKIRVEKMSVNRVCETLEMPNALRTFSIFWGSQSANIIKPVGVPNQPAMMTNTFGWCPCPTNP